MTDADRQAATAIAAILARASGDRFVIANEIVQALRGHGWRPTPARPHPPPYQAAGGPPPLRGEAVHAIADRIRATINPLDHLDNEDVTR